MGRLHFSVLTALCAVFQLTRPLMARQEPALVYSSCFSISTHATTQGATNQGVMNKLIGIISTHAPTQGATIFSCQCPVNRNFNSRAHARRDLRLFSLLRPAFYFNSRAHARRDRDQNYWCPASTISTHAPTQGATSGVPIQFPL